MRYGEISLLTSADACKYFYTRLIRNIMCRLGFEGKCGELRYHLFVIISFLIIPAGLVFYCIYQKRSPEESRNLLVSALSGLVVFILFFFIFGLNR